MPHSFNYQYSIKTQLSDDLVIFFNKIAKAYIETKEKRWLLAVLKYTSGMNRFYAEDVLLDFAVALESLLSLDKEQIGYKLGLYLALLVGDSYSKRKQITVDMKKFYSLRSKFVHGNKIKITEDNISIIERVGNYLSKALIKTCGVNIEKDLIKELDFMSLLGAPKYVHEQMQLLVTEEQILDTICKYHGINSYTSYKAILSKDDDPDDDYTELLIEISFEEGKPETFQASFYLSKREDLKDITKFSYWLSNDDEKGYFYYVNYTLNESGNI